MIQGKHAQRLHKAPEWSAQSGFPASRGSCRAALALQPGSPSMRTL